jgi:hypothetical protein
VFTLAKPLFREEEEGERYPEDGARRTQPQPIACEVWSLCFLGFRCKSLIISHSLRDIVSVIHYDVTICMKLDPGIHIVITWFSSKNQV